MACRQSLSEKDFSCPICCDIFKDPVLLACSHSICKGCVQTFWNRRGTQNCPICRTVSTNPDPPINIVLRDICVLLREETSPDVPEETAGCCGLHGDPLTLFCMEDQQPVCEKCRNTKQHKSHRIRSTKDASQDLRKLLHVKLRAFEEKLGVYKRFKLFCDETAEYIKMQSQHTETQIKEAFEKLHQFLENEKAARITALRREEEQKSEIIKKKMEEIRSGILSLSRIIESIEEQLVRNDFTFLVNFKAAVESAQCTLQDHVRPSGVLIDVAKHVGNMMFNVSKKLQAIVRYTPVTLDPNSAHPYLVVSDDLTSIVYTDELFQQLPANPERFDGYTSVLGSQGFGSGTHSWDIEVGDSTAWAVGVITESAYKNRENPSRTGLWYVGFCNGKYGKGCSPEILTLLRVRQKIQRIGVQLDWDKGKVMFTESAHNVALHVFKHTFTERVFPYFYNHCKQHLLKIMPVKTIVNAQI